MEAHLAAYVYVGIILQLPGLKSGISVVNYSRHAIYDICRLGKGLTHLLMNLTMATKIVIQRRYLQSAPLALAIAKVAL